MVIQPCRWQHGKEVVKGKPPDWQRAGTPLGKPAGPQATIFTRGVTTCGGFACTFRGGPLRQFFIFGFWTLVVSAAVGWLSSRTLSAVDLIPSILILIAIIGIGVVFDILGVAATAADEAPFHAMSVDRVPGGLQAAWMARHADRVATFASDFVGDIAGTLSGAVGATIVYQLVSLQPSWSETVGMTLALALVAALTVGGKAAGKAAAVRHAHEILSVAGRMVASLERFTGLTLLRPGNPGKSKRSKRRRMRPRK